MTQATLAPFTPTMLEIELRDASRVALMYPTATVTVTLAEEDEGDNQPWVYISGWCRCANCIQDNPDLASTLGQISGSFAKWRVSEVLNVIRHEMH